MWHYTMQEFLVMNKHSSFLSHVVCCEEGEVLWNRLLDLNTNMWLSWKVLPGANTLAYLSGTSVTIKWVWFQDVSSKSRLITLPKNLVSVECKVWPLENTLTYLFGASVTIKWVWFQDVSSKSRLLTLPKSLFRVECKVWPLKTL